MKMTKKEEEDERRYKHNYYIEHKKEHMERQRKYRQTKAGKEADRKYRQSDKRKICFKRYENTSKGKLLRRIMVLRYREKKELGKELDLTRDEYLFIFKLHKNKCFNCGKKNGLKLTKSKRRYLPILYVEHFYPIEKGYGLFYRGFNASVLCHKCNRGKGKRLPKEFYSKEKLQEFEVLRNKWKKFKND